MAIDFSFEDEIGKLHTYRAECAASGLFSIRPYAELSGMTTAEVICTYAPDTASFTWKKRIFGDRAERLEKAFTAKLTGVACATETSTPTDTTTEDAAFRKIDQGAGMHLLYLGADYDDL